MNVKPGDMAYITHPTLLGRMVNVMYQEPKGDYRLPDGFPGKSRAPGLTWVCESLGSKFDAPVTSLGVMSLRPTMFAAIEDRWLRPIRGQEGEDETLKLCDVPDGVTA